ncbi:MAG: dual specificity protein phosphatase 23 [Candidatus Asgardarchaeia archaeon]
MSAPPNFSWVIDKLLAGSAYPHRNNFQWLYENGIRAIVSLTETPIDKSIIQKWKFKYLHIPIPDFDAPTYEQANKFLKFVETMIQKKKPVLVHCTAGCGRTGTMLAIYLIYNGYDADKAIDYIRQLRPCSIETWIQEEFIYDFSKRVRKFR